MEMLNSIDHDVLKGLYYGREVFVTNKEIKNEYYTHWFENIGAGGFYTTENQGKPMRYISINSRIWLDFKKLKPWLTMINKGEKI